MEELTPPTTPLDHAEDPSTSVASVPAVNQDEEPINIVVTVEGSFLNGYHHTDSRSRTFPVNFELPDFGLHDFELIDDRLNAIAPWNREEYNSVSFFGRRQELPSLMNGTSSTESRSDPSSSTSSTDAMGASLSEASAGRSPHEDGESLEDEFFSALEDLDEVCPTLEEVDEGMDGDIHGILAHLGLGLDDYRYWKAWSEADLELQPSTGSIFSSEDFPPLSSARRQPEVAEELDSNSWDPNSKEDQRSEAAIRDEFNAWISRRTDEERNNAFIVDQLVSRTQLQTGIYADLRPTNFVLELHSNRQQPGYPEVVFYIGAKLLKTLFDQSYYCTVVKNPDGQFLPVTMLKDMTYPTRYRCSFSPTDSGVYWVGAMLGQHGTHHIDNSPSEICVGRDYGICSSTRAILTRYLNPEVNEMDTPGVEISAKAKIWGVTSNLETEEIFAADRDGHEILVFSVTSGELALKDKFAAPVPVNGMLFRPTGITYDEAYKYLYVTDKDNHRVCIFQPDGNYIGSFGKAGYKNGQLYYPWGVAVSPDGELIAVADSKNHRIQLFDRMGTYLRKYTVFESNPFEFKNPDNGLDSPRGITFNNSGKIIYVTDFNLHKVYAVDVDFMQQKIVCPSMEMYRPQGLAVDNCGNLLICDSRTDGGAIRVLDPRSDSLMTTLDGTANMTLAAPVDISICRGNFVCVVDMGGTRIRIF